MPVGVTRHAVRLVPGSPSKHPAREPTPQLSADAALAVDALAAVEPLGARIATAAAIHVRFGAVLHMIKAIGRSAVAANAATARTIVEIVAVQPGTAG